MGNIEIVLNVENINTVQAENMLAKIRTFITANTTVKLRTFNYNE